MAVGWYVCFMEPAICKLLTTGILQQAAQFAQVDSIQIKPIRAYENFVFEFPFHNGFRILRITHSSHRSVSQVISELDFINFLANGGANVASSIANVDGQFTTAINALDGTHFIVAIFTKANGVGAPGFYFTPEVLKSWGSVIGKMHQLAKIYHPSEGIELRHHWHEDPLVKNGFVNSQLTTKAKARLKEIMVTIDALPKNKDTFGLIHSDLHHGNFFVHDNQVTAFDFDDCCYQYFVHDIAIALYYALRQGYNGMSDKAFVVCFLKHLMVGYNQQNMLPGGWIEQLPLFLELRNFVLHEVLTQKMDLNKITPQYLDTIALMQKLTNGELPLMSFDIVDTLNNA